MKRNQENTALLHNGWATLLPLVISIIFLMASCSDNDNDTSTSDDDVPMLQCNITYYDEFGSARLDITEDDMTKAGFTLGDVISIAILSQEITTPYYDGFYSRSGEYVCVSYPSYPSICFTLNNSGLPDELKGLEGQPVTIKMKEKGGKIDVQQSLSMKYTNVRTDYNNISDAEFANARAVSAGHIASGILNRSSSPFCNDIGRANYVSEYLEREQVKTVINLADTEEKMLSYQLPSYSRTLWDGGNVILCPLKVNPTADDFNNNLIKALIELPSHPAPYVVHCMEGKDRTGYACALLEGLCGATYEEIVDDYLTTYNNYYQKTPEKDGDICNTLLSMRLNPCLMYYAGISDESQLPKVDFAKAFADFLLSHSMTQQQLDALTKALTTAKQE